MKTDSHKISISKLAIGTVQFGLNYGISNKEGQTSEEEVAAILTTAKEFGIDLLDTAFAYGESESILGQAGVKNFDIISKFPRGLEKNRIISCFNESLQRLKLDSIYGYLSHHPSNLMEDPSVWDVMLELQNSRKVQKIGTIIYEPKELEAILKLGIIPNIVQLPYSIADRRFESYFPELVSNNVQIHTRSAFLQGLFFMNPNKLPSHFSAIKPLINQLNRLSPDSISKAQILIAYCMERSEINKVVIGVNNHQQLKNNLLGLNNFEKLIFSNLEEDPNIPEDILLPFRWPKI